jgi:hypothetical protein
LRSITLAIMTHSDPSSEPNRISPIDDEAEALWEPLTGRNENTPEDQNSFKDEERLYTDTVIRQNENASRFLFFSFMLAGLVSIVLGFWYIIAQQQNNPTQNNTPLQVPETPPLTPILPDLNITPPPLPTNSPSPGGNSDDLQSPLSTPGSSPTNSAGTPSPGAPSNRPNQSGLLTKPTPGEGQINPTLPPPPQPTP